jgi:hypothetical protein
MSDQEIRGALQARLLTVSGLPAVAPEGVSFEPTIGTPYVAPVLVHGSERPFDLGGAGVISAGTLEVSLVYPSGFGTAAAEAMATSIKAAFPTGLVLEQGATKVLIRWAERRSVFQDSDFIRLPVSIGWRVN